MLGNILFGIVTLCTFISYYPQAKKLIKTKKSADLSINSWILWVVSSLSYTLYAILVSKGYMIILETSLELIFCITILFLAVKYRTNGKELEY